MIKNQLKIVIVGHVDHGKSTLVGRIFHDTGSMPEGKLEAIQKMCEKRGMPFEYSFLMDALQEERNQGITIDTTQIWFRSKKRDYVIIDAPGHKEFLKNMISGAASSEAALLVIDAYEGVKEQSKRHGYILSLLGVKQVAVILNKMDLVGYSEEIYNKIIAEYGQYLSSIGVSPMAYIPISARNGDLITEKSFAMPWYHGKSVIQMLDGFENQPSRNYLPLRFPVQDIYKFDERRIIAGRIESGELKTGDEIMVSPGDRKVKIKEVLPNSRAQAGESIGLTFEEQIFIERGQIISHVENPPILTNIFRGKIFWIGDNPLKEGNRYKMKLATSEYLVEVKEIEKSLDTDDLSIIDGGEIAKTMVGEVIFQSRGLIAIDEGNKFVLMDGYHIAGGGMIDMQGFQDQRVAKHVKSTNIHFVDSKISHEQRAAINHHKGGIIWFTGLSGAGKTTLALELQQQLFARGYQVYVLDGDNVRSGLCSDLGFSAEDRSENIRRVGEVAALFADAGMIVITAFISPYKQDRRRAKQAAPDKFHHIYIKADIGICESRDPKGLYKKARAGDIKDFTGISAPFEEPENPDLVIDTNMLSIEESVAKILKYVESSVK